MRMDSSITINSLLWADILVAYALFVMQNYLTGVWKLSLTHAAAILNFWNGIYRILPAFFLYLVDSFLGNFKLLIFTSISYSAGIVLVFLSAPPILADSTHTCKDYEPQCIRKTQKSLLYAGLVLIAVGIAGKLVSIKPFLAEQRERTADNPTPDPRDQVVGLFGLVVVSIAGALALPYIKPWTLRFGIPAICTVISTLGFISGWHSYKKYPPNPNGTPWCNVLRVLVATSLKIFQPYPVDDHRYYGIDKKTFSTTSCLRALHKAAIISPGEEDGEINRWKLCSIAEVEDAKIVLRMVPMWMTFIVCGIVSSAGNTYFVEQAGKLNRNIGKLRLPIQILLLVRKSIQFLLDNNIGGFVDQIRRFNVPLFGIGSGILSSVLCCISAAGTERMRLKVVRRHGLLDNVDEDVPMSMYWLIFQFVLLGYLDWFLNKGVNVYFNEHSPESMQGCLENLNRAVYGLGFMCNVLSVYVVGRISERGGKPNWFQETLNKSRLDRYFWVLTVLSSVNYVVFVFFGALFRRNERREQERGEQGHEEQKQKE